MADATVNLPVQSAKLATPDLLSEATETELGESTTKLLLAKDKKLVTSSIASLITQLGKSTIGVVQGGSSYTLSPNNGFHIVKINLQNPTLTLGYQLGTGATGLTILILVQGAGAPCTVSWADQFALTGNMYDYNLGVNPGDIDVMQLLHIGDVSLVKRLYPTQ